MPKPNKPTAKPPKRKTPETRASSPKKATFVMMGNPGKGETRHVNMKGKKVRIVDGVSESFQKQMDTLLANPEKKSSRVRNPLPAREEPDFIQQEIRAGVRHTDGRKRTNLHEVMIPIETETGRVAYFNVREIAGEGDVVSALTNQLRVDRRTRTLVELKQHVEALRSLLMGWGRPESMASARDRDSSR